MRSFGKGKLHSGSGHIVKNRGTSNSDLQMSESHQSKSPWTKVK